MLAQTNVLKKSVSQFTEKPSCLCFKALNQFANQLLSILNFYTYSWDCGSSSWSLSTYFFMQHIIYV